VDELPEIGNLRYFADLRPHHVYDAADSRGLDTYEVVALLIHEYRTYWKGVEDPDPMYEVVELEAQGRVVDENPYFDDLHGARTHLDPFPGLGWEELPATHNEAVSFIQERLAQPPGR
jgi:hypothetical protein